MNLGNKKKSIKIVKHMKRVRVSHSREKIPFLSGDKYFNLWNKSETYNVKLFHVKNKFFFLKSSYHGTGVLKKSSW